MTARARVVTTRAMPPLLPLVPPRTISALFSERLLFTVEQLGVDAGPLWKLRGVSREAVAQDVLLRLDEDVHLALWHRAVQLTGDEALAIRYAESTHPDSYGLLGLAAKTAPDVGAALRVAGRFVPAFAASLRVQMTSSGGFTHIALSSSFAGPGVRYQLESGIAEIWQTVQRIAAVPVRLHAVTFAHAAPAAACVAVFHGFFGVAPRFGAPASALVLADAALGTPLARADAGLHRYLCAALEQMEPRAVPTSIADRCSAILLAALPEIPRQAAVARSLGLSQRNLQRKLASEGTAFEELVETTRQSVAEAMLQDRRCALAEVAAATGFSEASAFSRAYKRWTGRRPSTR